MTARRAAAALLALGLATPVAAWTVEAGLQHHRLREHADDGGTLVREQGLAPRLRLAWQTRPDQALTASAGLAAWATRADYDGRTQAGAPLSSRTDSHALVLDLGLRRALPVAGWHAEAGLAVEHFRRAIRGSGIAAGLDERLTQPRVRLGLGHDTGAWSSRLAWLAGPRAPLSIRFDAGLFDPVTLRSGRLQGLEWEFGRRVGADWWLVAGIELLRVGASQPRTLARGGDPAGLVQQPRWRRESVSIGLQYRLPGD